MSAPRRRNVAKLLARLNPKGMPLQPSPGHSSAVPDETALDIAAALGAAGQNAPGRLAVLVLCLRWWPGVFEGPSRPVGYRLVHHKPKWHETLKVPLTEFTSACCERIPIEAPAETEAFRAVTSLLSTALRNRIRRDRELADDELGARLWAELTRTRAPRPMRKRFYSLPLNDVLLSRILDTNELETWARVVVAEYRAPNHCQTCTPWGRAGEVPKPIMDAGKIVRVDWITCDNCVGAGVLAWSVKRRARALRISEHTFRNFLNSHHDGALALLRELEWRGARRLVKRLGRPDER